MTKYEDRFRSSYSFSRTVIDKGEDPNDPIPISNTAPYMMALEAA
jgi:hypothetical protein